MTELKNYQRQTNEGLDIAWLELKDKIEVNGERVRYIHIQFDVTHMHLTVDGFKRNRNLEPAIKILDVQGFDNVLKFHTEQIKNETKLLSSTPVDAALVWVINKFNFKI